MKKNFGMTALVSLFARAYHTKESASPIYRDELAERLLTKEEYEAVASSMKDGRDFFLPLFEGTAKEALEKIVNTRLAPAVVSRSAFCLDALKNAVFLGAKQFVVLGSGYDSMPYCDAVKNGLHAFELDRKEMIEEKLFRLERAKISHEHVSFVPCDLSAEFEDELLSAGFKSDEKTFVSMLGLCHYLDEADFSSLLKKLSALLKSESELSFDYPLGSTEDEPTVTEKLAEGAGEKMKKRYSSNELEELLKKNGFKVIENLSAKEVNERFFEPYNLSAVGTGVMLSPEDFALCRAVKI